MKKLISTLVIAAAISSPVFAEKGHEHGDSKDQLMGGMMMGHEQMMAMHEHMQKMHDMMGKIKAETDPEKRQQLMQEHMRVMQKGMRLMGDGMGMEMTVGESSKMDDMDMIKRMEMMEERMGMMQMMMGQMMDHESESQKTPVHKHKK